MNQSENLEDKLMPQKLHLSTPLKLSTHHLLYFVEILSAITFLLIVLSAPTRVHQAGLRFGCLCHSWSIRIMHLITSWGLLCSTSLSLPAVKFSWSPKLNQSVEVSARRFVSSFKLIEKRRSVKNNKCDCKWWYAMLHSWLINHLGCMPKWIPHYRSRAHKKIGGEEEHVTSNFSITAESPTCTKSRMLLRVYDSILGTRQMRWLW